MNSSRPSELRRLIAAFGHSVDGLKTAWREAAFRTEVFLALILLPLALILGDNGVERALLSGSLMLVFITELLNTSVERTINRISTEWHELSKQAKDIGSAAVLASLINAALVWFCVLFL